MCVSIKNTLVPEALCFTRDVFFLFFIRRATSELRPPIVAKLCGMIAIWVFFIMQVQKFGGPSPQRNRGPKHAKFAAISDNFRLRSPISPEWAKISKIGKQCDHQRFLPHSREKSGELWSTNYRELYVSLNPPKLHFSGDYISAPRGCWPLKF